MSAVDARCALLVAVLTGLAAACAVRSEPVGVAASALIHGQDDRVEAFAVADDGLRALAEARAVAIATRGSVTEHNGVIDIGTMTLGEKSHLCSGEPFAEQPSVASCSGLLVARDLVLTAGHCAIPCDEMQLLVSYYYQAEGELAPLDANDLYGCGKVLATADSASPAPQRLDYAWIRLDREVVGPAPAPIQIRAESIPLEVDERLTMFGFPSGIPLKVDQGARVTDARHDVLDYFEATTDSFSGNSGSPIFDAVGLLVGIQNRGDPDFVFTDAHCNVLSRETADLTQSHEQATYAFRALEGLCAHDPQEHWCSGGGIVQMTGGCAVARPRSMSSAGGTAVIVALVISLRQRRRMAAPTRTSAYGGAFRLWRSPDSRDGDWLVRAS